jgi:hypothetical protein
LKEPAICSRLFEFLGSCGKANYPFKDWEDAAFTVGAWEKVPIRILSVSADATIQTKWQAIAARMFAGNSFNADPMTPYATTAAGIMDLHGDVTATLHTAMNYPADAGMQLPAGQPWEHIHLDVHLRCTPLGASYPGSLSVWYRLDQWAKVQNASLPFSGSADADGSSTPEDAGLQAICATPGESWEAFKQNPIGDRIVISHEALYELSRWHSKCLCPHAIAIWRDSTSPGFDLGNESVVLDSYLFGEIALWQPVILTQALQPMTGTTPQLADLFVRYLLWVRIHISIFH